MKKRLVRGLAGLLAALIICVCPSSAGAESSDNAVETFYFARLGASADQLFYPELSENDPTLAEILHLAGVCNAQQKRMIVAFIQMLQAEEYGEKNSNLRWECCYIAL